MSRIYYTRPSITEREVEYATDAARNGWGEQCYAYFELKAQPCFIYNMGNHVRSQTVNTEIEYAKSFGHPVSVGIWSRLMLAVEGAFDSHYVGPEFSSCATAPNVVALAQKYVSTDQIDPKTLLDEIAGMCETINGTGERYHGFWTRLAAEEAAAVTVLREHDRVEH